MFVTASRLHPESARHQNKGLKEWFVMCPEYQFNLLLLIHMQILTSVKAYQFPPRTVSEGQRAVEERGI